MRAQKATAAGSVASSVILAVDVAEMAIFDAVLPRLAEAETDAFFYGKRRTSQAGWR